MKTAFISDIHGHLIGLEIVLNDIKKRGIDRLICLGDLVEGGENDHEVIEYFKSEKYPIVKGNHDEFNSCELTKKQKQWLQELPEEITENNLVFSHISPRLQRKVSIKNDVDAWNVFDERTYFRLAFIGHLHFPVIFGEESDNFAQAQEYYIENGIFELNKNDRYIISFGAIAYPRGGGKFIRYGIFDDQKYELEFIILEGPLLPYGLGKFK